ncbi:uncharacterized protein LOC109826005 isoform X2 [Asparagus officinalis]|uniref:uncharacterized protein LOC109826005 isoform X2 n=1 Tax=Asparagus officinalis TaxID=4686 RepID=UPI00098DFF35|nr:uncharacterized protein LOC109826005 isoform X2 [Asparagus officinalis]
MPLEVLKLWVSRARPVWSISIMAAIVGFVMLGRRLYKMKQKGRIIPLKIAIDDKGKMQKYSLPAQSGSKKPEPKQVAMAAKNELKQRKKMHKKKKTGSTLLVLGTGSCDVLAIDVALCRLKWKVSDCYPGFVFLSIIFTGCSFLF